MFEGFIISMNYGKDRFARCRWLATELARLLRVEVDHEQEK